MMDEKTRAAVAEALGCIPQGLFILTAQHEDRRTGALVSWVQQVCFTPPMVSVAVGKGRPIMPLISESGRFALCQLQRGEKVIFRKFAAGIAAGEDPFLGLEVIHTNLLGLPVLAGAMAYLECEVACHMDVEGDHDLFVGIIHSGGIGPGEPKVHFRRNGFRY
jgi:flavin reductase (DIM6/NTAB) family NADH-FMN oxidoreductase RutF